MNSARPSRNWPDPCSNSEQGCGHWLLDLRPLALKANHWASSRAIQCRSIVQQQPTPRRSMRPKIKLKPEASFSPGANSAAVTRCPVNHFSRPPLSKLAAASPLYHSFVHAAVSPSCATWFITPDLHILRNTQPAATLPTQEQHNFDLFMGRQTTIACYTRRNSNRRSGALGMLCVGTKTSGRVTGAVFQ